MGPPSQTSSISSGTFSKTPERRIRRRKSSAVGPSRYSYESKSSSRSITPVRRGRRIIRDSSSSPSRSRSPQRYSTREKPNASRCIGVFGLSVYTTQQKIREIFNKFGPIERIQVVIDAQTGRSRGFCFIYFEDLADAKAAKDACSGMELDDRRIRVDYSITQRPHTPTPGIYMGRPTRAYQDRPHIERYYEERRNCERREDRRTERHTSRRMERRFDRHGAEVRSRSKRRHTSSPKKISVSRHHRSRVVQQKSRSRSRRKSAS